MEFGALIAVALAALAGLALTGTAALKGWQGWLELRRLELERGVGACLPAPPLARIEVTDLKERVRRLEAIADGVEL